MTPSASRKASERQRRKERGEVEYKGWLSASDHAALTQMARDSGMTQAQVVGRLIGMVGAVRELERVDVGQDGDEYPFDQNDPYHLKYRRGQWIRHSDLTAAIGLNAAKAGNEGEG